MVERVPWFETQICDQVLNGTFAICCRSPNQCRDLGHELSRLRVRVDPEILMNSRLDHYYYRVVDMNLRCISIVSEDLYLQDVQIITYEHLMKAYKHFPRITSIATPFSDDVLLSFCT